jgi:uncharacterized membrane protein YraQ (UPF0718 family)
MFDWLGFPSADSIWQSVFAFFKMSPFWFYLFWGVVIALVASALGWLFPVLRSLTSAVILTIAGMLYAYRKGETDATRREQQRIARERRRHQRSSHEPDDRWRWW